MSQFLHALVKDDKYEKGKPFPTPTPQLPHSSVVVDLFFSLTCRDVKFTFTTAFLSALIFFNPGMNAEGRAIQKEVNNDPFYFVSFDLNMTTFLRLRLIKR